VNSANVKTLNMKARVVHELEEFVVTALLLALFLGALAEYRRVMMADVGLSYTHWGIALIEALIVSKVILIGDALRLERRTERTIFATAVQRAFVYGLLITAFEILEHSIRELLHGSSLADVRSLIAARAHDLAAYAFLAFAFLVLFFALREAGRLLGEEGLAVLLFRHRTGRSEAQSPRGG
jgi:hypothetical protein